MENYTNADIFDVLDEAIYISDIDTYEILYANQSARKLFECEDLAAKRCYELFHQRKSACEHCKRMRRLVKNSYEWESYVERRKKHFQFKNKLIMYQGRRARIEIAFDVTDQMKKNNELYTALNLEKFVTEQVAKISKSKDLHTAFDQMLEAVGSYMGAERAYIFEIYKNTVSNTYEWCAPGVIPQKQNLQNLPLSDVRHWTRVLEKSQCILVEDIEDIAHTDQEEYRILKMQDITSCIEAPILQGQELVGFIGVDNAPPGMNANILYLLKTLGYFVSIVMQNAEHEFVLESLSYVDEMTGAANWNAYSKQMEHLRRNANFRSMGLAMCDLNGLKKINDLCGHHKGDEVICRLAAMLREAFGARSVFRIGGDEFAVLMPEVTEDRFQSALAAFRSALEASSEVNAAIGALWYEECHDPEKMMKLANRKMYQDKQNYYEQLKTRQ